MANWAKDIDRSAIRPAPAGAIYVAVGARYVQEALDSARTVKRWMPDLPITIFTSDAIAADPVFDQVVMVPTPNASFEDKILAMQCSPYGKTLYLDSDTRLCDSLEGTFQVLDHFHLWGVFDPAQRDPTAIKKHCAEAGHDLPEAIIEHNTGALGFKKTEVVSQFLDTWYAAFIRGLADGINNDQVTFRKCLYESKVRFATLPSEYNFRTVLAGLAFGKVRLMHGRGNLPKLERKLNSSVNSARFSMPGVGVLSRNGPLFRLLDLTRRLVRRARGG